MVMDGLLSPEGLATIQPFEQTLCRPGKLKNKVAEFTTSRFKPHVYLVMYDLCIKELTKDRKRMSRGL